MTNHIHGMPQSMEISRLIDHTLLRPDCTPEEIQQLCAEAVEHGFAAVCIPPYYVKQTARILENEMTKVATVVGFPYGYSTTPAKVEEVKRAIDEGVDEVDVVVNIPAIIKGDWSYVKNDISSLTLAAHLRGKVVKFILETCLLNEEQIKKLCEICNANGVDYVKTSTGINGRGASVADVVMLKKHLNSSVKIKASGGIDSSSKAQKLIEAGAKRIGCSKSLKVIGL